MAGTQRGGEPAGATVAPAAETGRILLRAAGVLARQQTDALHAMLAELAGLAERRHPAAPDDHPLAALQLRYLRLSLHACIAQMRLGLESAAAVQAAALDLLAAGAPPASRAAVDEVAAAEDPD
jgi:hypothetical protein